MTKRVEHSKQTQHWIKTVKRVLYWSLPPLIIFLIIMRVDLNRLRQLISNADVCPILSGIALIVLVMVTGALRWYFLLRNYGCASLPVLTTISEYWKCSVVGVFIPGSLGSDAYRVMVFGRQKGDYLSCGLVIVVEKLAALCTCTVLVVSLYPLLTPNRLPGVVAQTIDVLYIIFLSGVVLVISTLLVHQQNWFQRMDEALNTRFTSWVRRLASLASVSPIQEGRTRRAPLSLLLSALSPMVALPATGLSLTIYIISAIQSQLFFQGLGYTIPFSLNLFITPLLFLMFTLPVSFGGIGIREGAFVVLYGAFGVPTEIALVVSFCSLLSSLISYALGASLFLFNKRV